MEAPNNIYESLQSQMGQRGGKQITGTEEVEGPFAGGFLATEDCVINTVEFPGFGATLTTLSVPAWTWLPGTISTITLTSGKGLAAY